MHRGALNFHESFFVGRQGTEPTPERASSHTTKTDSLAVIYATALAPFCLASNLRSSAFGWRERERTETGIHSSSPVVYSRRSPQRQEDKRKIHGSGQELCLKKLLASKFWPCWWQNCTLAYTLGKETCKELLTADTWTLGIKVCFSKNETRQGACCAQRGLTARD